MLITILACFSKKNEQDFIEFLEDFPLPKSLTIDDVLDSLMPILSISKTNIKSILTLINEEKEERLENEILRKKALKMLEEMEAKKKKDDENNNDLER